MAGINRRKCCCTPPNPRCGSCGETFLNASCAAATVAITGVSLSCCLATAGLFAGQYIKPSSATFDFTFQAARQGTDVIAQTMCRFIRVFNVGTDPEFYFTAQGATCTDCNGGPCYDPTVTGEQVTVIVGTDGTSSTGYSIRVQSTVFNGKAEFTVGDCFGTYVITNTNSTCYTGGTATITLCTA